MSLDHKNLKAMLKARQAADLDRRTRAERILEPSHLTGKGQKNAAGVLMTTLGGTVRPITSDDLRHFKDAADKLAGKLRGGITAAEAIQHSTKEDQARCRTEIRQAVPFRLSAGTVAFSTTASEKSKAVRHIVTLQFDGWAGAVASPNTPLQAAARMAEQPLKFQCDCGKFTFWLRYIATVGGWVHGRPEPGFPKIRNPNLKGVACKHLLRVLLELPTMTVRRQLARMVETERNRLEGRTRKTVLTTTGKEAKAVAAKQMANPRDVKRVTTKLMTALAGKKPARQVAAKTADALRREAQMMRGRLQSLKLPAAQIEQIVQAMLLTGGVQP